MFGFVAMILWGYHSDQTGERVWHASATMFVLAAAMVLCKLIGTAHPVLLMAAVCIGVIGNQCFAPCFWAIPGTMLTGTAAAGGIAMINALGNLGGWAGPTAYGVVRDSKWQHERGSSVPRDRSGGRWRRPGHGRARPAA